MIIGIVGIIIVCLIFVFFSMGTKKVIKAKKTVETNQEKTLSLQDKQNIDTKISSQTKISDDTSIKIEKQQVIEDEISLTIQKEKGSLWFDRVQQNKPETPNTFQQTTETTETKERIEKQQETVDSENVSRKHWYDRPNQSEQITTPKEKFWSHDKEDKQQETVDSENVSRKRWYDRPNQPTQKTVLDNEQAEKQDSENKDRPWKQAEKQDSENKDRPWKQAEKQDSENKDRPWKQAEKQDSENKDRPWKQAEKQDSENKDRPWKQTEKQDSENKDRPWKQTEKQDSENKDRPWKQTENQDSEKDRSLKQTEKQDNENKQNIKKNDSEKPRKTKKTKSEKDAGINTNVKELNIVSSLGNWQQQEISENNINALRFEDSQTGIQMVIYYREAKYRYTFDDIDTFIDGSSVNEMLKIGIIPGIQKVYEKCTLTDKSIQRVSYRKLGRVHQAHGTGINPKKKVQEHIILTGIRTRNRGFYIYMTVPSSQYRKSRNTISHIFNNMYIKN